uniref:Outer dense fiber protein 2-like n=1 Tax=Geotrypetes seraphini TaxID=260995 RepID=A0A6P8QJN3_GEOSA|nr:outer dense fiber protein 2-like [Geotrypetes seraphini]
MAVKYLKVINNSQEYKSSNTIIEMRQKSDSQIVGGLHPLVSKVYRTTEKSRQPTNESNIGNTVAGLIDEKLITDIKMTEYDKKPKLGVSQHYRIMLQSDSKVMHNSDTRQYAEFLQQQECKLGPDRFLDSKKYMMKRMAIHSKSLPTLVNSSTKKAKNLEDQDQSVTFIEIPMSKNKNEEKFLKRSLGDSQRQQRNLQRMITDYENVVRKKTLDNEREINDFQHQHEKSKQKFLHEQEWVTKDKILQNRQDILSSRDHQRKYTRSITQLELRYSHVLLEMQRRRAEIEKLHQEYEDKLKQKENEEVLLRNELAELTHSDSVEEQKETRFKNDYKRYENKKRKKNLQGKQHQWSTFENKQLEKEQQVKALEAEKQNLDAELAVMKEYLNIRNTRESRKIVDITNQLIQNADTQRQIIQEYTSLRSQTSRRPLKSLNNEKLVQLQYVTKQHAGISQAPKEGRKQTLEKSMEHFHKVLSDAKEAEKSIFRDMRMCENLWRKQDKFVNKLQENLTKLRKENSAQMRKTVSEGNMKERILQDQISKAFAELTKYENQKNKSYERLLKHRALLQEDRLKLRETEKEYARLCKMRERNQVARQTVPSYNEYVL